MREVRNWLNNHSSKHAVGPTKIWIDFHTFIKDTHNELIQQGHSREDLKYLEIDQLMTRMAAWLAQRSSRPLTPLPRRTFPDKWKR